MQEIILKVRYFERGLSKSLKVTSFLMKCSNESQSYVKWCDLLLFLTLLKFLLWINLFYKNGWKVCLFRLWVIKYCLLFNVTVWWWSLTVFMTITLLCLGLFLRTLMKQLLVWIISGLRKLRYPILRRWLLWWS